MTRHVVVGLNQREAQAYAIEYLRDEPASQRRITSVEFASSSLHGLGPDSVVHVLPRCFHSNYYNALLRQLQTLRARGVTVKTGDE